MKKQFNIPNLTALTMILVAVAGTRLNAASNIKSATVNTLRVNTQVYERVLNPYINIKTDQRAVGNTFAVRDRSGKIIRTGVVTSGKVCTVPTGKLTAGVYTVHIGGYLLQEFTVI